jgi:hypothetical protein
MPIELNTRLVPMPGLTQAAVAAPDPLGPLASLVGTWKGHGLNTIFRLFHNAPDPCHDTFLKPNKTTETLEFTEIPGEIPNRGLVQADIALFGLTYLQQIADANVKDAQGRPAGIHIEPGIWITVPTTTDPNEVASVARLANIPHGTAFLAQGTPKIISGAPTFKKVDITPFFIGQPTSKAPFPNQTLSNPPQNQSGFRRSPTSATVGITQAMVDDPTTVLRASLNGKTIESHTRLHVTTRMTSTTTPNTGSGIADIAFLEGLSGRPNARVTFMDATFWISPFTFAGGNATLLQYLQIVHLDFGPLTWPHVSVAALIKQPPAPAPAARTRAADGADPGLAGPAEPAGDWDLP